MPQARGQEKTQQLRQTALTSLTVYSYNTVCVRTGALQVCAQPPGAGRKAKSFTMVLIFLIFFCLFFFPPLLLCRLHSQIDRDCHLRIKGPTVYILYIDVRFISYIPNATIYIIEWYYMYIFLFFSMIGGSGPYWIWRQLFL